jgi:hypothetical protein
MSSAKQCDVCGKFYNMYNAKDSSKNVNGLMFLNIDEYMKYFSHDPIDCCPTCMDLILTYIESLKALEKEEK